MHFSCIYLLHVIYHIFTDGIQDQPMLDLLEELADFGAVNQQCLSGSGMCNSDDEEAGPELEKEEAELSIIMSQRWDNEIKEHSVRQR